MLKWLFGSKQKGQKTHKYFVYKNRFNEVKPYEVTLLRSDSQKLEVHDIKAGMSKTFLKINIIGFTFTIASSIEKIC